ISEPADLAIFRLASLARDHVKVLLSGEGSDELFAGYPKYRWATRAGLADWLPAGLRGRTFRLLERAAPARLAKARIALRAMSARSEADRFQAWFAPFTRYERDVLLPGVERDGHVAITARTEGDLVQRMLYADCHAWLVDNLLERGDRMAMAASVESRPPFLDHELVELAFRLPSNVKLRDGTTKWVVKEVARRRLPASIVDRRKVGFRVPLDAWFRGELREMANDLLLGAGSFVGGRMDRRFVASMLADHARGRRDEEIRIWTLLCLEVWHEVFFRNTRESEG
ncbi:MAG TPA: asparagine synthase C-terminal domain-containing protein, partial [Myxococcota bacterium]|nr:asparagine synthase C-terminal domain-containing protein [Myxococcota bacterium]